jgi:hypothetical protein
MTLIPNRTAGTVITSSWGNAIRDATVQVCTSSTRPSSPAAGMVIYETDTNLLLAHNGTAWVIVADGAGTLGQWTTFTAQLQQNSANISQTASNCRYAKVGKIVTGYATLTATAAGTANSIIRVTTTGLPTPAQSAITTSGGRAAGPVIGSFSMINDAATATYYSGVVVLASSNSFILYVSPSTSSFGNTGTFTSPNGTTRGGYTVAINDVFSCQFTYEAA